MKPSVTVDERGVILHVTNDAGEGVAVPLNAELVTEATNAAARLLSPEGKRALARGLGRLFLELLQEPEKKDDGKKV
jgi:hypothetical protein